MWCTISFSSPFAVLSWFSVNHCERHFGSLILWFWCWCALFVRFPGLESLSFGKCHFHGPTAPDSWSIAGVSPVDSHGPVFLHENHPPFGPELRSHSRGGENMSEWKNQLFPKKCQWTATIAWKQKHWHSGQKSLNTQNCLAQQSISSWLDSLFRAVLRTRVEKTWKSDPAGLNLKKRKTAIKSQVLIQMN